MVAKVKNVIDTYEGGKVKLRGYKNLAISELETVVMMVELSKPILYGSSNEKRLYREIMEG